MIDNVTLTTKGIKRKKASYGQERMWVLAQLHPESAAYNVRGAVRLVGTLNKVAVEESFSTIIARHEVLRTNFEFIDGLVMQIIHPAQRLKLDSRFSRCYRYPTSSPSLPQARRPTSI